MNKFVKPPKEEILIPWEEKEISKIKAWERIYREPQNFEHVELTCMWNHGDYKVFEVDGWEKVMIKNSDYVEAWHDNYWHVKWSTKMIPYN